MENKTGLKGVIAGIVTVSDSCAQGKRRDESGPVLETLLVRVGASLIDRQIVSDDEAAIARAVKRQIRLKADVVLTTGGTGLGPRDVTPEATRLVLQKEIPGLSEAMRSAGSQKTRRAFLSRGVCGVRGKSLIINLPGSPKGAAESWEAIVDLIPHALAMIRGEGHS
ncbi:MAG: MogA/MoaB family molybdenum cofactor biosynthesis protein [Candidatus Omnitrophota bacterium]